MIHQHQTLKMEKLLEIVKELYLKYKNRYIGEIRYEVRVINIYLEFKDYNFKSKKELDEFVISINNDIYCLILRIKKIRIYEYFYDNEIIHSSLCEHNDEITERCEFGDWKYTFLKIDKSLTNVKRCSFLKDDDTMNLDYENYILGKP